MTNIIPGSITLYLLAALCQALIVFKRSDLSLLRQGTLILGCLAVIVHGYSLTQSLFTPQGLNLGFYNAASLVAWFITLLGLLSTLRRPTELLFIVLFPLAAFSLLCNELFGQQDNLLANITTGIASHILLSILAYSVLTLAAIQAAALQLLDHQLKHRHLAGIVQTLPPLQTMETLLFELVWIGLALLTLAIGSGAIYLDDIFAQHLVHKTVLSIAAWIIFALLLWGRHQWGWRSQTAVRWTLGGFIVLMLGYFGSKLVLELIL
jgi:ABC-type uncharacterized transport system permease subunit